jgi:hypothetical protein
LVGRGGWPRNENEGWRPELDFSVSSSFVIIFGMPFLLDYLIGFSCCVGSHSFLVSLRFLARVFSAGHLRT